VFQPRFGAGFINLCDKVREAQVAVDRKRAGFSEAWRDGRCRCRCQGMPGDDKKRWKDPAFSMGKSTISMAIFNSKL